MRCQALFAIPGDLSSPTGGYGYDRQILGRIEQHGVRLVHLPLPGAYPFPTAVDLEQAAALFQACSSDNLFLIDGLALGGMPAATIASIPGPVVALVHHPLAHETGFSTEQKKALFHSERHALAASRHVIVTGEVPRKLLHDEYGVPADRITLAQPGTVRRTRATGTGSPVSILAVGAVSPRKAYVDLVMAMARLQADAWQLTIAGSLTHDPAETDRVRKTIAAAGLTERIVLTGALDDAALERAYAQADLFVMSSRFEGFGMVLTEALAHGLAIVTTNVGAALSLIPGAAALKVSPGDIDALSQAIQLILGNQSLRQRMSAQAWHAAASLPTWEDTAATIARVLIEARQ